jgi:outer membrane protein assembly factor BamB
MRNPHSRKCRTSIVAILITLSISIIFSSCIPTPNPYSPPERTDWAPDGPRTVPYIGDASDPAGGDVLGNPSGFFRTMHGDSLNSDEVAIAAAPVFEQDWVAEPNTFNGAGPTFDKSGNLYFSPGRTSGEEVFLISLDPNDGSRRWAITGVPTACGAPLVLDDPDNPGEQIIYVGCYDRAVAVKPDADTNLDRVVETGEMVWDVSTGLTAPPDERPPNVFGLNCDPTTDTLIGLAADNHMYVLDRKSGSLLLSSPYSLPDIAPSPATDTAAIPEFIGERVEEIAAPLMGEISYETLFDTILGNSRMVANYFSVDPHTGKLWVAATAPDGEDGAVDGVSEYGALYCLKLASAGGGLYVVDNLFHTSFVGGTASTPALSADGHKVYVGDNFGKLIAIDASDGSILWELDVGEQIFGSISVASDNGELYCVTTSAIIKVTDHGTSATESWRSTLDMYPQILGSENVNLLTASICANGIAFQAASATMFAGRLPLPLSVGCGLLDRETGKIRYFAEGREESVSIAAMGPDGSIYIGHSPIRRLFSVALFGGLVPSVTGGVQKFSAKRLDLLIRDAVHAAADRANNVSVNGESWSTDVKDIEVKQIGMLIDQCRAASVKAIADGDLAAATWTTIDGYLTAAESALSLATPDFTDAYQNLQQADSLL